MELTPAPPPVDRPPGPRPGHRAPAACPKRRANASYGIHLARVGARFEDVTAPVTS